MSLAKRPRSISMICPDHGHPWRIPAPFLHVVETVDDITEAWWECGDCGWHTLKLRASYDEREVRNDEAADDQEDNRVEMYVNCGATWHDLSGTDDALITLLESAARGGIDLRDEQP